MKACEQKFPIVQHFHLRSNTIWHHKLRRTNGGAVSGFYCTSSFTVPAVLIAVCTVNYAMQHDVSVHKYADFIFISLF
jgi:hypothetical protein